MENSYVLDSNHILGMTSASNQEIPAATDQQDKGRGYNHVVLYHLR